MGIYISIFIVFAIFSFYELFTARRKKITIVLKAVVLMVLFSLIVTRGGPYGDYYAYKDVFEHYTVTDQFFVSRNFVFEPLYSLIQWNCKIIIDNYIFFKAVIGAIVLYAEHCYARSYINFVYDGKGEASRTGDYYFTIVFFLWGLYKCNVLFIRSSIALVICLNAIKYIQKKNLKKFLFLILVAAGFHYSAFIFLPAYFIYQWHGSMIKRMALFACVTVLLSVGFGKAIMLVANMVGGNWGHKLSRYFEIDSLAYGVYSTGSASFLMFWLRILLNIGVLIFAGLYLCSQNRKDRYLEGYFNLYLVGSALYIGSLLQVGYAFARISIYYNVAQIPMLMSFFQKSRYSKSNRVVHWIVLSVYLFARFYINTVDEPFIPFWIT